MHKRVLEASAIAFAARERGTGSGRIRPETRAGRGCRCVGVCVCVCVWVRVPTGREPAVQYCTFEERENEAPPSTFTWDASKKASPPAACRRQRGGPSEPRPRASLGVCVWVLGAAVGERGCVRARARAFATGRRGRLDVVVAGVALAGQLPQQLPRVRRDLTPQLLMYGPSLFVNVRTQFVCQCADPVCLSIYGPSLFGTGIPAGPA